MYQPRYAFFYDFHTSPELRGIGRNFDAESFAARLERCGVDFLTFPARCNMGMAYYDTQIGIRHYGLDFDLFGELVAACKRHGIAVNAYFNGGISQEEARLHPEWRAHPINPPAPATVTPYFRTMCGNTPYREHLIAMMSEVAHRYPVTGFFVDSLGGHSCRCESCLEKMRAQNLDSADDAVVAAFTARSCREFAAAVSAAMKKLNPEFLLYFNCIGYEDQLEFGTYLDFECIPTKAGCDYEYLPLMSRYMRTLDDRPRLNMTGRFNLWGDFGGLRPEAAIRQELLTGLCNGMRPNLGDHLPPDGRPPEKVLARAERVFKFLQQREAFFTDSTPLADIAVLFPKSHREIYRAVELRGAVRMLCELHRQFDIVTLRADWRRYALLVLPDTVTVTPELAARLRAYLASGGKIITSGDSGLEDATGRFMPEWPVETAAPGDFAPAYFRDDDGMDCSAYADGRLLRPRAGAQMRFSLVKPEIAHCWDGRYAEYYNPPSEEVSEFAFLTVGDQVAHFSHRIFSGYKQYAATALRDVFGQALELTHPQTLLKTVGLPHFVRVTAARQPSGREIVHLLAYIPERRAANNDIIEDELTVEPTQIRLRTAATRATLEPENLELATVRDGEYLEIQVPRFRGCALIAVN